MDWKSKIRPEEGDSEWVWVDGAANTHVQLEGYGPDQLEADYPPQPHTTLVDYLQPLAHAWHKRFADHRAVCGCSASTTHKIVGIPMPSVFEEHPAFGMRGAMIPLRLIRRESEMRDTIRVCVLGFRLDVVEPDAEEQEEPHWRLSVRSLGTYDASRLIPGNVVFSENVRPHQPALTECWTILSPESPKYLAHGTWMPLETPRTKPAQPEPWLQLTCSSKTNTGGTVGNHLDPTCSFLRKLESTSPAKESEIRPSEERERVCIPDASMDIETGGEPRRPFRAHLPMKAGAGARGYVRLTEEQNQAIQWAYNDGLGMFAYDYTKTSGPKRYFVSTWRESYAMLFHSHTPEYRYIYEGLLPEYPQKIMMDIDAGFELNPRLASEDAIDALTVMCCRLLKRALVTLVGYKLRMEDCLVLDSSSSFSERKGKASRHVIVNAPGRFFRRKEDICRVYRVLKTLVEAGLVQQDPAVLALMVCTPAATKGGNGNAYSVAELAQLNHNDWYKCALDWSIYPTDSPGLMRHYGSCKKGHENRPLIVAKMNRQHHRTHEEYYLASLVGNVEPRTAPGWTVTDDQVSRECQTIRATVSQCRSPDPRLLRRFAHQGESGKRAREGGDRTSAKCTKGALSQTRLTQGDPRHVAIVRILSTQVSQLERSPILRDTGTWTIERGVWRGQEDRTSFYSVKCNSKWCPIKGTEHRTGKTKYMLVLNRNGQVKCRCFSPGCGTWVLSRMVPKDHDETAERRLLQF